MHIFQYEISNYQKERNKTSTEITQSRIKASTKLINKLTPILEEYSKKNSIRIIIQKKNIVMGKKDDDITKDILEIINQKVKSIKSEKFDKKLDIIMTEKCLLK